MTQNDWFRRIWLPGLAFKAAVIGGGYATGRELATFFVPSGPVGGLWGLLATTAIWSAVAALTFAFAVHTRARDYRTFFRHLLGRFWWIFEVAYLVAILVILAAFAAAAGSIGASLFGWPEIGGALLFMAATTFFASRGNEWVEPLFKYVSVLLYGTYAIFLILALSRFGDRIVAAFAASHPSDGWVTGGVTYASYNIIGAIVILPVLRHLHSRRDAVIAGLLAGPLAMLPAVLFFLPMLAFFPGIEAVELPSDFLLERLNLPWFRVLFQLMVFAALLESGVGGVHAVNERIAQSWTAWRGGDLPMPRRAAVAAAILALAVFVAGQFGLVALVAEGYRWLAYLFLLIYVLPLSTLGLRHMLRVRRAEPLATITPATDAGS